MPDRFPVGFMVSVISRFGHANVVAGHRELQPGALLYSKLSPGQLENWFSGLQNQTGFELVVPNFRKPSLGGSQAKGHTLAD